ncbi:response regulator [Beggiatoa leptomitoformis]|uniref:histidine kinase n=1 Tax=Beggiatoa leptomitoformis TaxID=288004 RepID=A0A2N9YDK5_9GAMM|nr:response regulator [Beggiatoa leptomitoformis]AUI68445.1 response regulator [Beggiatoa leptomitoformis]QGX03849.1 response regulator [Beggiatoa leptomitoformis]
MNNIRIAIKFFLLSLTTISALIFVGLLGIYYIDKTYASLGRIYNTADMTNQIIKGIGVPIEKVRELTLQIVMSPRTEQRVALQEKHGILVNIIESKLQDHEKNLLKYRNDDNDIVILRELKTAWQDYLHASNLSIDYALHNQREAAFISTTQFENQVFIMLQTKLSNWLDDQIEDANALYVRTYEQYQITYWISLISIVFAAAIVFFFSFTVARNISIPLLSVKKHLQAIAQGNPQVTPLIHQGKDEIADIVNATEQLRQTMEWTINQANTIAAGNYSQKINPLSADDKLGTAIANMNQSLRKATTRNELQDWLKTGQTELNDQMSGEQELTVLARNIITFLTVYLNMQVGLFYLVVEPNKKQKIYTPYLNLLASYAYHKRKELANSFEFGEGIVGQVAIEREPLILTEVPEDYMSIQSGLGKSVPRTIIVYPLIYEETLKGVLELGSFRALSDEQLEFLKQVAPAVAIAINTAQSRLVMQSLLDDSQRQADVLQQQTEELQTQAEELQTQQEELRQANEELENRTHELELQKESIHKQNISLEKSQEAIENKAREVEQASRYKSEFLANMSHELRTPLNSMLILSQLLASNKENNLTDKQVEYAQTIRSAGADLLTLINDILDLSKVEAGKLEVHVENIVLADLLNATRLKFQHVAEQKQLVFTVKIAENVPDIVCSDAQRIKQIINNLLSNAFKFTEKGSITLFVERPQIDVSLYQLNPLKSLAISVIDTGIGIAPEKHTLVFEAFRQADGTTSRRFGGTGLGLSISRQLSRLLGGELILDATTSLGNGSCFTLYLPERLDAIPREQSNYNPPTPAVILPAPMPLVASSDTSSPAFIDAVMPEKQEVTDDRDHIQPNDKFILIIEDDPTFAKLLQEIAQEKGFKALLASDGKAGLQLAQTYQPHAIILDVGLPLIDGWTVMECLKDNANTRHIPVHFMSATDQDKDARQMGAIGYLLKPISMEELSDSFKRIEQFIAKTLKHLLIVVDNMQHRQAISEYVVTRDVEVSYAETMLKALQSLQTLDIDCVIVDIDVANDEGLRLLEQLNQVENMPYPPVIVYANRELTSNEEQRLAHCSQHLTIKSVYSPERLLDEATLFLHQVAAHLPQEKQAILCQIHDKALILKGKKVLIADDDMRNTFALGTVLEKNNMLVIIAKNGKKALEILQEQHDIDIVLMDIMMPEMDGYEAMRQIRAQPTFRKLPIIALTAKAMKGDRVKAIEAGANDYLSKPVDVDKLISLLRVWLYR